jgi:fermentation-respiration switch protein FrsA (DUF1100 family)
MRIFLLGLGTVLATYILVLVCLFTFQRRLLFVPDTTAPDPVRLGLTDVAVLHIPTEDGLSLIAWHVPPADPNGFTVLLLHGNAGNIGHRANRLRRMREIGWGVLLLEYRGYGGNAGSPTEDGLTLDANAGLTELRRRGVPAERTLLWGESLGTGLAIRLAAENPVAAVLLDAPYTSIVDAAQGQYPYVPVRPLLKDKFDSLSRIAAIQAPILVMQGSADRLVPPAMGRALMQAASAPTELWVAEGAGHEDLGPYGAIEAAAAFVAKWCPLQPGHDQK